jgi:hypothetical protein
LALPHAKLLPDIAHDPTSPRRAGRRRTRCWLDRLPKKWRASLLRIARRRGRSAVKRRPRTDSIPNAGNGRHRVGEDVAGVAPGGNWQPEHADFKRRVERRHRGTRCGHHVGLTQPVYRLGAGCGKPFQRKAGIIGIDREGQHGVGCKTAINLLEIA